MILNKCEDFLTRNTCIICPLKQRGAIIKRKQKVIKLFNRLISLEKRNKRNEFSCFNWELTYTFKRLFIPITIHNNNQRWIAKINERNFYFGFCVVLELSMSRRTLVFQLHHTKKVNVSASVENFHRSGNKASENSFLFFFLLKLRFCF